MEKKFKDTKAAAFFKKNVYYVVIVACILAIGVMITVSALADRRKANETVGNNVDNVSTEQNDNVDTSPSQGEVVNPTDQDKEGEKTEDKTEDKPTVQPLLFDLPAAECEMYFEYAMDQLVFHQTLGCWAVHKGCDFTVGGNGQVLAIADGKVTKVTSNILEGVVIEVEHRDGYVSTYKSLADNPAVKVGDTVNRGDVLGVVSDSAYNEMSDGAHLHLELKQNGAYIDPMSVLPEALK